jgi:hypothetical protein
MKQIKKIVLFNSDTIRLEKLMITVGDCRMMKFREIRTVDDELDVRELKEIPTWYLRELKLKALGL